jgi:Tfp pilus assembly protein PilF
MAAGWIWKYGKPKDLEMVLQVLGGPEADAELWYLTSRIMEAVGRFSDLESSLQRYDNWIRSQKLSWTPEMIRKVRAKILEKRVDADLSQESIPAGLEEFLKQLQGLNFGQTIQGKNPFPKMDRTALLREVIELDPQNFPAYDKLATLYISQNQDHLVLPLFVQAYQKYPHEVPLLDLYIEYLIEMNDFHQAYPLSLERSRLQAYSAPRQVNQSLLGFAAVRQLLQTKKPDDATALFRTMIPTPFPQLRIIEESLRTILALPESQVQANAIDRESLTWRAVQALDLKLIGATAKLLRPATKLFKDQVNSEENITELIHCFAVLMDYKPMYFAHATRATFMSLVYKRIESVIKAQGHPMDPALAMCKILFEHEEWALMQKMCKLVRASGCDNLLYSFYNLVSLFQINPRKIEHSMHPYLVETLIEYFRNQDHQEYLNYTEQMKSYLMTIYDYS